MSDILMDFLRRDECQPLTQEQMNNAKAQFHPSNTANVNIVPYEIYSPNERVIGEWQETVDGVLKFKPVYKKRCENISLTFTGSSGFHADASISISNLGITDIDRFVGSATTEEVYQGGYTEWAIGVSLDSTKTTATFYAPSRMTCEWVEVQYVKTTDSWTPV